MVLLKRIMWPRRGEEVAIYQNGKLLVEGHVIYSGDDAVTILDKEAISRTISAKDLSQGIDNRSMSVKKKTGPLANP